MVVSFSWVKSNKKDMALHFLTFGFHVGVKTYKYWLRIIILNLVIDIEV